METKKKREKIYSGKAKDIFNTDDPAICIQYFKDDITAFNKEKSSVIQNKGVLNNKISNYIFNKLKDNGIENHLIEMLNEREQLIHKLDIIPIEVVVRNISAGSICKRLGLKEGDEFQFMN